MENKFRLVLPLVFVVILAMVVQQAYADTLLGSGVKLTINGNSTSGILDVKGHHYKLSNISTTKSKDQIKLSGYAEGSYRELFSAIGTRTNGIEYKFVGIISNNNKNTPIVFTALLASNTNTSLPDKQNNTDTKIIVKPPQTVNPTIPMLLISSKIDRAYMAHPYEFVIKIFDPKTNPQKSFDQFNGGISNVNISVTIVDQNNKIIGQVSGNTDNKGIYHDKINMPYTQYLQQQTKVIINATKLGYTSQYSTASLLLIRPQ